MIHISDGQFTPMVDVDDSHGWRPIWMQGAGADMRRWKLTLQKHSHCQTHYLLLLMHSKILAGTRTRNESSMERTKVISDEHQA